MSVHICRVCGHRHREWDAANETHCQACGKTPVTHEDAPGYGDTIDAFDVLNVLSTPDLGAYPEFDVPNPTVDAPSFDGFDGGGGADGAGTSGDF